MNRLYTWTQGGYGCYGGHGGWAGGEGILGYGVRDVKEPSLLEPISVVLGAVIAESLNVSIPRVVGLLLRFELLLVFVNCLAMIVALSGLYMAFPVILHRITSFIFLSVTLTMMRVWAENYFTSDKKLKVMDGLECLVCNGWKMLHSKSLDRLQK